VSYATRKQQSIGRSETGVFSISYDARHRVAAAYVKDCGKELAGSRTAMPMAGLRIVNVLAT
jgi:hypothetical protein